jgi:hypothetical protein
LRRRSGSGYRDVPPGLEPAVSEFPAAGVCQDPAAGDVVTFTLESDVPRPRCGQVRPDQHLRFLNETGETIQVHLAHYDLTIAPGQSKDIEPPVGSYLASGVHDVKSRLYAGTGPEVVVLQD